MLWHIKNTNYVGHNKNKIFMPPKILHYFNKEKPWISKRGKWADTEIWWGFYDDMKTTMPLSELKKLKPVEKFNKSATQKCPYCELIITKIGPHVLSCINNKEIQQIYNDKHDMIRLNKINCPKLK